MKRPHGSSNGSADPPADIISLLDDDSSDEGGLTRAGPQRKRSAAPAAPKRLAAKPLQHQTSCSHAESTGFADAEDSQQLNQGPRPMQTQRQQQQQEHLAHLGDEDVTIAPVFGKRPGQVASSAAAPPGGSSQQSQSKRAKAVGPAPRAAGARSSSAGNRQATLQAKGFGSLAFSMSLPAASNTAANSSSQPAASSQLPRQASTTAAATAAAAAAAEAPGVVSSTGQWVDRYEPAMPEELVVHKRKVAEVQQWLQTYLDSRAALPTRVLLITGPPGCGKSATLRVLADSMGFEVLEWSAPVPTLWADHQYQAGAGVGYSSKLDDFDMFVTRCKFAALPLKTSQQQRPDSNASSSQQQLSSQQQQQQQQSSQQSSQGQPPAPQGHSARQKLLLLDDLPHVVEATRRQRLAASLQDLASTSRCPVVVVVTTEESSSSSKAAAGYGSNTDAAGISSKGLHKDLLAVLHRVGASTINFNPVTNNTISKALLVIAGKEGYALDLDTADGIAASAAGDLRNAIHNLQVMLQHPAEGLSSAGAAAAGGKKGKAKAPRRPRKAAKDDGAAAAEATKRKVAGQMSRDQHLSAYHAIGKILHYKRQLQPPQAAEQLQAPSQAASQATAGAGGAAGAALGPDRDLPAAGDSCTERNSRSRPPLELNPEAVVQGSGLEALQVTGFLSENYCHFFAEDAMEQAAAAAASLSDAGLLACRRIGGGGMMMSAVWDEDDPVAASVQGATASSVAARGLLFSNTKPAPSRWLPLKGPSCFLPERAAAANLSNLSRSMEQLQGEFTNVTPLIQQIIIGMAGQLLHAGRQERAAQVLPYLQVLSRQQCRQWLHLLLPGSWCHVWSGSLAERQSDVLQKHRADIKAAAMAVAVHALGSTSAQGTSQQQHSDVDSGSEDSIEDDLDPA